jgi:hypothetical protein
MWGSAFMTFLIRERGKVWTSLYPQNLLSPYTHTLWGQDTEYYRCQQRGMKPENNKIFRESKKRKKIHSSETVERHSYSCYTS